MTRAYDTRPNLKGYDALTPRGLAKFMLAVIALVGAQIAAERLGVQRQLLTAIQLFWLILGLSVARAGWKAISGRTGSRDAGLARRYSERTIGGIPPRLAAAGQILVGALLVLLAISRITEILSE